MGAISILLAISSIALCVLPFISYMAVIPAMLGVILGLADISKNDSRGQSKAKGIIGVVINIAAILFIGIWGMFFSIKGINEAKFLESKNETTRVEQNQKQILNK